MKPVKEYLEYRDFLGDYYEEKKLAAPYFSYRFIGKKVGIDPSHLVKILQKQRHIGAASIETFIAFCGLSGTDAAYFDALVHFNKAKSERDCKHYYEKILSLKGVKTFVLEKGQYEYYSKWYYSAILTLLDFYDFRGDYKAFAEKLTPPITVSEAKKAIALLEMLGLIEKKTGGGYRLTNKIVTSGEQCKTIDVKSFQEATMQLALESLERHSTEKRNISTVTITIAESDLDEINQMIKTFRAALLNYAQDAKNPDKVYQLNVQLFPLTE
jgi:uncharacterized protein (TIGR02147 family)